LRRAAASAPAKAIIVGEHFVVKGAGALVAAVGRRVRVRVERLEEERVELESSLFKVRIEPKEVEAGRAQLPREALPYIALLKGLAARGYSIYPHRAVIEGGVPPGAGLGSSASTAVAYALAYTALHGDPLSGGSLFEAAMEAEKVAHGNPSGVDVAIAVDGGFLFYRRGSGWRKVESKLRDVVLVVADTGVKRSTRDVVNHVLATAGRLGRAGELIYRAGEALALKALEAVESGDEVLLGLTMDAAHGLLASLGASSSAIERVVYAMRSSGALGAKLTGAGWGGAVIGLAYEGDASRVSEEASKLSRYVFVSSLGASGASIDSLE